MGEHLWHQFRHVQEKDNVETFKHRRGRFSRTALAGRGQHDRHGFLSDDKIQDRIVWVFDGFFSAHSVFNPVGVMRHELGQRARFRHEHIRPEAPDLFDPESLEHTVEITTYDPKSVMHYVSGNVGNPELTFTDADRTGAPRLRWPRQRFLVPRLNDQRTTLWVAQTLTS